jgi:hypothetical protein
MVRRVLSVLALLPLLLPPGLCVCHAGTAACAAGAARGVDEGGPAPLAHFCPGHGHSDPDSPGGPHDHAPGCPAMKGLDHWAARPGTAALEMALTDGGLVVPFDAAARPSFAAAPAPHLGSPDEPLPLYLSLHTLLI